MGGLFYPALSVSFVGWEKLYLLETGGWVSPPGSAASGTGKRSGTAIGALHNFHQTEVPGVGGWD